MDFERIGMLLHMQEKLAGHPHLSAIMAHVTAELKSLAAEAKEEPIPGVAEAKAKEQAAAEAIEKEKIARAAQQRLDDEKADAEAKEHRRKLDEAAVAERPSPEELEEAQTENADGSVDPRQGHPARQSDDARIDNGRRI
jgi:site-specific DNA-cytosine methylase